MFLRGAARVTLERRFRPRKSDYQEAGFLGYGGGIATAAGRQVGARSALAERTVFTCVKVITEDLSSMPFVMHRLEDGSKARAIEHPLYWLLKHQPNKEMTAQDFVDCQTSSLLLRGNAVAVIERDQAGRRIGLWPINWDHVRIERDDITGELVFIYSPRHLDPVSFMRQEVWFIRGPLTLDGVTGLSVISEQRESIGEALAQQEHNARFYQNAARPSGVLKTPATLSDTAFDRVKKSWEQLHTGLSNAHKVAILEEGLEWQSMGLSPEDAQTLEMAKFSRSTIAGFFRVPAPLVNDQERSTFQNTEELRRLYLTSALTPWMERFEQTAHRDLLTPSEKRIYDFALNPQNLLRGDVEKRYDAYSRGIQWGFLSPNDVRRMEDMNIREGGEDFLRPVNMVPMGGVTNLPPETE